MYYVYNIFVFVFRGANARQIKTFLDTEIFGIQYSKIGLNGFLNDENGDEYNSISFATGTDDSFIRDLKFSKDEFMGGFYENEIGFDFGISSIKNLEYHYQRLFQKFHNDLSSQKKNHIKDQSKITSELITELLKIYKPEDEQIEGVLSYEYGKQHSYFAFDNSSFESFPSSK